MDKGSNIKMDKILFPITIATKVLITAGRRMPITAQAKPYTKKALVNFRTVKKL